MSFKKTNTLIATLLFFFCKKSYIDRAISHGMASNLDAPDIKAAYERGDYPRVGWESEGKGNALLGHKSLHRSVYLSLVQTICIAGAVLFVAWLLGEISPERSLDKSKVFTFSGAFLAVWGGLVQFHGVEKTWDGVALHEKVHAFVSLWLFVPGAIAAFSGALI